MPSLPGRPTSAEHQAAVSRRLELLRAELAGSPGPPAYEEAVGAVEDDPWWSSATRVPQARLRAVEPLRPEIDGAGPSIPAADPAADPAPWVPIPGRHASRRDPERPGWLPETLRGRVALGSTQLTVVAVLVAVGLAVTAWSVVRADPEPIAGPAAPVPVVASPGEQLVELPAAESGVEAMATPAGTAALAPDAATSLTVDVAGKVRRPGIAVLPPGSRVVDALEAAGGARGGVALTSLNLARPLVDGEQILVGVPQPVGAAASALAPGGAAAPPGVGVVAPGALVNLNTATEVDLDTLPDVGPVTAGSIIAWRSENGGFTTVDELLEVDGIGEATLTRLAPLVTV